MRPIPTQPRWPRVPHREAARQRGGFTLVELLVVIGVLIVLTVMTVGLVNVTQNEDRVRAGAAQVQSYLEGARDRAIHAKEPRGVRFLLDPKQDPNDPDTVSSLIYIGAPEVYGAGHTVDVYVQSVDPNTQQPRTYGVRASTQSERNNWINFFNRGLISNGSPIQIEGRFYTIVRVGNEFLLTKTESVSQSTGLKYRLFLNPTVLPNQEPRQLPRAVVIDLNNSILPDDWRESGGGYRTMDVLFSPNGTVTGLVASAGVVHLVVADQVDVDLNRGVGANTKEGNERIVSLRTQTGNISVHYVDPVPSSDPFRYAALGEKAK